MSEVHPFQVAIPDSVLNDLHARIRATRWIHLPVDDWSYGTSQEYLRALLSSWLEFDWRGEEADINELPQFTANIDGREIHFIHKFGSGGRSFPIILTSGPPSCFLEYRKIIDLLCEPDFFRGLR